MEWRRRRGGGDDIDGVIMKEVGDNNRDDRQSKERRGKGRKKQWIVREQINKIECQTKKKNKGAIGCAQATNALFDCLDQSGND